MQADTIRNSPLHEWFARAGAVFEETAGWRMPRHVSGEEAEYQAIRHGVAISDVSDCGKFAVSGDGAAELLDDLLAGDVTRLLEGGIRWTAMLDDDGRVVADVQVYNDYDRYFVTCAGALRERVLEALTTQAGDEVKIEDHTTALAALAVEGPLAADVPAAVGGIDASGIPLLRFTRCSIDGREVRVARIGFTGEFGFVFFADRAAAPSLAARIHEAEPHAVLCGQAVQAVTRLEVRAFDLARDVPGGQTALEAGLHWMIDFRKPRFRGRDAVLAEKTRGPARRLIAFVAPGAEPVQPGAAVRDGAEPVGAVANVAWSPALERTIGLAYLDAAYAWVGLDLAVDGADRITTVSSPILLTESNRAAA